MAKPTDPYHAHVYFDAATLELLADVPALTRVQLVDMGLDALS